MRSIVFTAALIIAACSVNARNRGTGSEAPEEAQQQQPSTPPPQQGPPMQPGAPNGPQPAAGGACGNTRNVAECGGCCEQANPKGASFYYANLDTCFCRTPGVCKSACSSTVCSAQPKDPDQGCIACLEQNEACYDTADQTCGQNADCARLLQCDQESQCGGKPEQ